MLLSVHWVVQLGLTNGGSALRQYAIHYNLVHSHFGSVGWNGIDFHFLGMAAKRNYHYYSAATLLLAEEIVTSVQVTYSQNGVKLIRCTQN